MKPVDISLCMLFYPEAFYVNARVKNIYKKIVIFFMSLFLCISRQQDMFIRILFSIIPTAKYLRRMRLLRIAKSIWK